MDYEKAMQWVAALRSGDFTQGKRALAPIDADGVTKHCCLGVMCEVAIRGGLDLTREEVRALDGADDIKVWSYNLDTHTLPSEVFDWAALTSGSNPRFEYETAHNSIEDYTLASLNDTSFTFSQIADLIERFWDQL